MARSASELMLMRFERGLTLREAAEQIGISKTTLQRLEKVPALQLEDLHASTAHRIARFYKRDIRDFISDCEPVAP